MTEGRDASVVRVLLAVLVANAAVAAAKLVYGYVSGSLAVRADGFHSLLDGVNNLAALVVVRAAARPPDAGHPYGHRKIEVLASLAIGVSILGIAAKTGYGAVVGLFAPSHVHVGADMLAVLTTTLLVNVFVAVLESRAGRKLRSPLLVADARHTLSDVFVTIAVLCGLVGVRAGFERADALAALIVLVLIAAVGYGVVRRAIGVFLDEAVIPTTDCAELVRSLEGVRGVRRVRSRGVAPDVRVDLIVEVDAASSVTSGHVVADRVEAAIMRRFADVAEVVVHIEPARPGPPTNDGAS